MPPQNLFPFYYHSAPPAVVSCRNLCVSALLEAVRDRTKTVGLDQVNRVLMQPHWRTERDLPAH